MKVLRFYMLSMMLSGMAFVLASTNVAAGVSFSRSVGCSKRTSRTVEQLGSVGGESVDCQRLYNPRHDGTVLLSVRHLLHGANCEWILQGPPTAR